VLRRAVFVAAACWSGVAAAQTFTVEGRVIDAYGRPIAGATVGSATTDRAGRYKLAGVAAGDSLVVEKPGYTTGLGTVTGPHADDIVLLTEKQGAETIEVHGEPPPSAPGATVVDREELQRIPGGGNDLVRTLTAMPGIVNSQLPTGFGGLVIRGSAPQDSKILIDDFEVPLLYHSLAFRAIVPTEAIDSLEYIPGGFDVTYGRAASGVVSLKTRAGADQASEQAELAVLDASTVVQGKAGETSYMVAARRSVIDLLLPYVIPSSANLSLTTTPHYYDGQVRLDRALSSHWNLTLSAIGSDDGFELYADKAQNADKRFADETEFLRVSAHARWHDGPWSAVIALSEMPESIAFELGAIQHLNLDRLDSTLRSEVTRTASSALGLRDVVWRLGGEADVSRYRLDVALPTPNRNGIGGMGMRDPGDVSTSFDGVVWTPDLAAWTDVTASLDPRIRLTTGLRVDGFAHTGDVAVEPRGQLQIVVAPHTTARLSAGGYTRPPEYQDELLRAGLHAEHSTQVIAGLEEEPVAWLRLQGSVYYTDRTNLVTNDANGVLGNEGRGTTYGAELLVTARRGPWFGWLAYSYSHSTRIDYPGAAEHLFEYDQPHSLNASLSWKRGKWQLGARFELYSGLPYTPVTGSIYNSNTDVYSPIYGPADSERAPLHHQLDLRIDHTWHAGPVALTGFIDVQNVYLNSSISSYSYSYDYSQRFAFKGLPIIPSLGLRGVL
jgi:outer membrane receptor protein involved in Fe transport